MKQGSFVHQKLWTKGQMCYCQVNWAQSVLACLTKKKKSSSSAPFDHSQILPNIANYVKMLQKERRNHPQSAPFDHNIAKYCQICQNVTKRKKKPSAVRTFWPQYYQLFAEGKSFCVSYFVNTSLFFNAKIHILGSFSFMVCLVCDMKSIFFTSIFDILR